MRKVLLVVPAIIAAILGWGYWHARTHASIYISIDDAAKQKVRYEVTFLDATGLPLAQAHTTEPYDIISIIHPELGDCTTKSGANYQDCFAVQSKWIPAWAGKVRYATITIPNCRIENVPVQAREYGDAWWLWWIPLPHVGGKPYGYFNITLNVDTVRCVAISQ